MYKEDLELNNPLWLICHKTKSYIFNIYLYKEDSALNYQQWLICHKTKPNQSNIAGGGINGFIVFPRALTWSETNILVHDLNLDRCISSDSNRYTKCSYPLCVCVYFSMLYLEIFSQIYLINCLSYCSLFFYSAICYPIALPANDSYFGQYGRTCMEFVRSLASPPLTCTLGQSIHPAFLFLNKYECKSRRFFCSMISETISEETKVGHNKVRYEKHRLIGLEGRVFTIGPSYQRL